MELAFNGIFLKVQVNLFEVLVDGVGHQRLSSWVYK